MEAANALVDVGVFVTDGCLGQHSVRLLAWPNDSQPLAVVVDGVHKRPRTLRGVVRCLALMIERARGSERRCTESGGRVTR